MNSESKNEVITTQAYQTEYNATKIFKLEPHMNYVNNMKKRHHFIPASPTVLKEKHI